MPKKIDLSTYPRKAHFEQFCRMKNPYFGVTVPVDVTRLVAYCKEADVSFTLAFLHAAALAADEIPEFRRRIHGQQIWEYEECPTSHIELTENDTYCYCTLRHHMPKEDYFRIAEQARAEARVRASVEDGDDAEQLYFVTCLPWLSYTSLLQPTDADSNPRISWGKYETDATGRRMMPVSVLLHHALADGLHVARFFEALTRQIDALIA